MFSSPHALFRTFGIAEVISWTLLIGGLILRAAAGWDLAVTIGGGIHGFVFLAYGTTAVLVAKNQRWRPYPTTVAIVSAVVPYATIPVDIWLTRSSRLTGAWRLNATEDPRDQLWHDRLMRLVIRHPAQSLVVGFLAVAVVFTVLVVLGPPV
ncbi:DUF3817 domain-containing protein [Garicola koreensis]|uniref:Integral membrane protein n=1 Tax=Garicola koreensis TaxID=1262554 RepID=A0A7W5TQN8_9MICC|nr:integral membrane protein [Garicola koreensis]